ncbi:MAG TPA: ABC transporter permease [Syntrophorhabdaceae bacterium]|nr:ABC transporter permease [Syntrophorhabdaceae bacterium]
MSISRIKAIFVRQFFLFTGNPTRLVSIFVWLIIDILQWGLISKYLGTLGQATFGFITVILGAVILWGFMTRIQQGIMMAFLEDVWSQNFINFFASPLTIGEYVTGLVLTSIATGLTGFLVTAAMAGAVFGYNILKIGVLLVPFMVILFIFGMAMGIFVSAMIFRLGPSAEWLGWPIPLVLSIFAGVFYPISTLPRTFAIFARLIPPSYVFESIRAVLATGSAPGNITFNLLMGTLLSLAYLLLTARFFIAIYRKNLRNGSIARFNAEAL